MTTNLQTVFDYLTVTNVVEKINHEHLQNIRSVYNDIKETNPQNSLKILAEKCQLVNDDENLHLLDLCVNSNNISIACEKLVGKYLEKKIKENQKTKQQTNESITTETISEVICQIFVKQNHQFVINFIQTFLLEISNSAESNEDDESVKKLLPKQCVLDVFIRNQLMAHGDTIDLVRPKTKFPLIDPITIVDEFDTWHFDHLHSLFELSLILENKVFPRRWKLTRDAKIYYRMSSLNDLSNEEFTIRNVDRPSTISLQRFIEDVCEKQNNNMATRWISALRIDDIFTFDDLASLKFTEWDELKTLSLNGKRTLKLYIDREKQMITNVKSNQIHEQKQVDSECELLANLHKIRLYFHYILVDHFLSKNICTPAKLNAQCVQDAFNEMRRDGFADDRLFDQMKIFFLPLTATKENLSIDDEKRKSIQKFYVDKIEKLTTDLTELKRQYSTYSLEISSSITKHINKMEQVQNDLEKQIQIMQDVIRNIEFSFEQKDHKDTEKINRDLIKPQRGFIMHGPPGTGKSEIMSTLSTRIGITMVAPPIAAGELNRPLVGESERIISDICMRCHRIPYLMCCISIDEIDSLTSKRNDKSSEGNVSKLSVLLSVIDGIKDVPNLMIFCATNRLHMIDEAFLRRMQGKFFVGRPSSLARKSILSGMKSWHMPSDLLENLTIATTNFSGAALRALRRLITVHCIDTERSNPEYKLDYRTILQLTDITARQYRILIGSETLPMLLLQMEDERSLTKNKNQLFNDLSDKKNSIYTGKIIINFHLNRIDIEAMDQNLTEDEMKKIVYQKTLFTEETNLRQLIRRLTFYGQCRNVQLLQLIDLNLLSLSSAYDERDKFETLKERLDECDAYRRSMIVYDLDSLVGINRSEGDSSKGRSTNLSLINHNIYTYIKEKFQDAYVEPTRTITNLDVQNPMITKEKWSIIIIHDSFLARQFYDDTKFTRSEEEINEENARIARANNKIKCVQCGNDYIEEDNKLGVCIHHDGFIYNNHSNTLKKYQLKDAISKLLNEEAEAVRLMTTVSIKTTNEKEKIEHSKQRFKYICCNRTVQTSHAVPGCKSGKHSLPTISINDWNRICHNNQEYENKRLALLQQRTEGFTLLWNTLTTVQRGTVLGIFLILIYGLYKYIWFRF